MRYLLVVAAAVGLLTGCGLFGRGGGDAVPSDPGWRDRLLEEVAGTPGVTDSRLEINDVDSGTGSTGPVVTGYVVVEDSGGAGAQGVVDEMMRRMSGVLGEESDGVALRFFITAGSRTGLEPRDFGYPVSNGAQLYDHLH